MPRIGRAVAVGFPHHIVYRGNNKERVFFNEVDRTQYLRLLKKYADKWDAPILAYCLMTNHVHLLIRPQRELSLCKMTQGVALSYAHYINRKYRRSGRLWESRYYSSIVGEERYLWAVMRYIEQNPLRARIVEHVEEYPFSSAKAHLEGKSDLLLGEEFFSGSERNQYINFLKSSISKKEKTQIRNALRTQNPFGSENFRKKLEKQLNCKFTLTSRGRPKHAVT